MIYPTLDPGRPLPLIYIPAVLPIISYPRTTWFHESVHRHPAFELLTPR